MMRNLRRFTGPVSKILGSNILGNVLGAVTGIILARLLDPAGKGELSAITTWPLTFTWMATLSLSLANIYFLVKKPELQDKLFSNSVLAAIVFSLVSFAILWFSIPLFLNQYPPDVVLASQLLSAIVFSGIFTDYLFSFLQVKGFYGWIASIRILSFVANLGTVLVFALLSVRHTIYIATGYFVVSNLVMILALGVCMVHLRPHFRPDFSLFRQSISYSIKSHLGSFVGQFNARLDLWLVVIFLSPSEVGWYSIAITVTFVALSITDAFSYVMFPQIARQGQVKALETLFKTLTLTLVLQIFVCLIIAVVTPIGLPLVFGSSFSNSIVPVEILLVGIIFQSAAIIIIHGLQGLGFPLIGTISEIVSLVATCLGLLILLPLFGYIGAACASALAYLVNLLTCWYMLQKKYPESYNLLIKSLKAQNGQVVLLVSSRLVAFKERFSR